MACMTESTFSAHFEMTRKRIHADESIGADQKTCGQCRKEFRCRSKLLRHMLSHTGEKPHVCRFCARGFAQSGHLKEHVRIHTNERPFLCRVCRKTFTRATDLTRHGKTHDRHSAREEAYIFIDDYPVQPTALEEIDDLNVAPNFYSDRHLDYRLPDSPTFERKMPCRVTQPVDATTGTNDPALLSVNHVDVSHFTVPELTTSTVPQSMRPVSFDTAKLPLISVPKLETPNGINATRPKIRTCTPRLPPPLPLSPTSRRPTSFFTCEESKENRPENERNIMRATRSVTTGPQYSDTGCSVRAFSPTVRVPEPTKLEMTPGELMALPSVDEISNALLLLSQGSRVRC
eukprot:73511_1